MSKAEKAAAKAVNVELLCVYSGDGEAWGVGEIIAVDADEAERLIGLGAAKMPAEAAEPSQDE